MAKLNLNKFKFSDFFKKQNPIYNDEYLTNGHFMVKTSVLTKKQLEMINTYPQNENTIIGLVKGVIQPAEDKKMIIEFVPEFVKFKVYDKRLDEIHDILSMGYKEEIYSIRKDYYNFIISSKCKVFIIDDSRVNPYGIYNDSKELIGIVLPMITDSLEDAITYSDYLKQLEDKAEARRLLKINKEAK